jgi:hypothetical protein
MWGQPLESNNVRFAIGRAGAADAVLSKHPGSRISYANAGFEVVELNGWSPRFQLLAGPGEAVEAQAGLRVRRWARDQAYLTVEPGDVRLLVHKASYHPAWQAYVNGSKVPVKPYKGWQSVELPRSMSSSQVEIRYRNSAEMIGIWTMLAGYILGLACLCFPNRHRDDLRPAYGSY